MISFKPLLLAASAAVAAMAMPHFANNTESHLLLPRQLITTSSTGNVNGYFYSLWMQSNTGATMDIQSGSYSMNWQSSSQNVVGGIGWNPGSSQAISYSGSFNCAANCYLSIYGWTENPLIEYYVVESYGTYNPGSAAQLLGTVNSDGGTYNIYHTVRVNQPSIHGTATFDQFWSVRTSHRVGGTVTIANHFNAWASHGLTLGSHNYQIVASEGYQSGGSSSLSVSHGGGSTPPPNTTSNPGPITTQPGGGGGSTSPHWGQCGGQGWSGPTACQSPYTCQVINRMFSAQFWIYFFLTLLRSLLLSMLVKVGLNDKVRFISGAVIRILRLIQVMYSLFLSFPADDRLLKAVSWRNQMIYTSSLVLSFVIAGLLCSRVPLECNGFS
ncbi:hypothetical protein AGABI1DRAFT_44028 [Agaricus bisporus var. burnettii JB137-S8]|uniref:Endo-1,4-beta-xylanase n=1 Tax=Agaricus bisporus var. burnettii (strain JB137-S8 / ATCC MYA-4627 / FGSC 10392) TaxID=597362 RepID=K5X1T9_AGABU|nr:uncharacterized protein AGABI1DRAFT_44028 [Agaricus bisporus var. burnettii JB137-S8]EKM77078.1 hypothetical protein AGABI1DRAFT_44028 [Agaricus bisporus var. burnettii JB137-S8]